MLESEMKVTRIGSEWCVVYQPTDTVLATCTSNSAAWRWIDQNSGAGQADEDRHYRIRNSAPFS